MAESLSYAPQGAVRCLRVSSQTQLTMYIAGTPASLSVLHFKVTEAISTPYRAETEATSLVADLPTATMLGKPASFTLQPIDIVAAAMRSLVGEVADALASAPSTARSSRSISEPLE